MHSLDSKALPQATIPSDNNSRLKYYGKLLSNLFRILNWYHQVHKCLETCHEVCSALTSDLCSQENLLAKALSLNISIETGNSSNLSSRLWFFGLECAYTSLYANYELRIPPTGSSACFLVQFRVCAARKCEAEEFARNRNETQTGTRH